jgi:hypothetical protein
VNVAAAFCDKSKGQLANVVIDPAAEGRVIVMAANAHAAIKIDAQGSASERVLVPGQVLKQMAARHPEAELISVRSIDEMLISIRSYSAGATVAVQAPRGQECFQTFPPLDEPDALETEPLGIDTNLMRRVLVAIGSAEKCTILQLSWALKIKARWDGWSAEVLCAGMAS